MVLGSSSNVPALMFCNKSEYKVAPCSCGNFSDSAVTLGFLNFLCRRFEQDKTAAGGEALRVRNRLSVVTAVMKWVWLGSLERN